MWKVWNRCERLRARYAVWGDVLIADCRRWMDRESGVSMKRNRNDEIAYTVCEEGMADLMVDSEECK